LRVGKFLPVFGPDYIHAAVRVIAVIAIAVGTDETPKPKPKPKAPDGTSPYVHNDSATSPELASTQSQRHAYGSLFPELYVVHDPTSDAPIPTHHSSHVSFDVTLKSMTQSPIRGNVTLPSGSVVVVSAAVVVVVDGGGRVQLLVGINV